jgi:CubicO group peptidase (beta-lactamase class C family)
LLDAAVAQRIFPGGVLAVGRVDGFVHVRPFGRLTYAPESPRVAVDTLYDLASLTKVVATTLVAMVLVDDGCLDLDAPVASCLPHCLETSAASLPSPDSSLPSSRYRPPSTDDRLPSAVPTVRHLLTHASGLPAWAPLYREVRGQEAFVKRICDVEREGVPGAQSVYSDLGFILLGALLERRAGTSLDVVFGQRICAPLGLRDTVFRPGRELQPRIAPTGHDPWRGRVLSGEVHDENAYVLGGVAGHAGLFGTASDLARLAQMLLSEGVCEGRRVVSAATVRLFTGVAGVPGSSRALGWDTPGGDPFVGTLWSARSYGHTGLTGTFLWIDPERDLYLVLLTNSVHPTRNDGFRAVRRDVADAVVRALGAP